MLHRIYNLEEDNFSSQIVFRYRPHGYMHHGYSMEVEKKVLVTNLRVSHGPTERFTSSANAIAIIGI